MADAWHLILARFGEIGVKGEVTRHRFLLRLVSNLEEALAHRKVEAEVKQDRGRVYLLAQDVEGALDAVSHTFGFVSASPATEVAPTLPAVIAEVAAEAPRVLRAGQSFAVRARRVGEHPFTSMDVAKACGDAAWKAVPGLRVDLVAPDVELHVEVRSDRAFVFTRIVEGPGGLPVGTQGKVIAHAASPRDAAAAWLLLRRGCTVDVIVPPEADARTRAAVAALRDWWPRLRVVEDAAPRAQALRIWARKRRATTVTVGEGAAAVAAGSALDAEMPVPVLRPLVGFSGDRLADLGRRTGFAIPEERGGAA